MDVKELYLYGLGEVLVIGYFDHGIEPLSFMKGREFLDQLSKCLLFKKVKFCR